MFRVDTRLYTSILVFLLQLQSRPKIQLDNYVLKQETMLGLFLKILNLLSCVIYIQWDVPDSGLCFLCLHATIYQNNQGIVPTICLQNYLKTVLNRELVTSNDITSAFEYVSTRRHHCEMKFHPKNELEERNTP